MDEAVVGRNTEPVNIHFENINCTVTSWRWPCRRENTVILSNISGDFQSGKLTAILGTSGCGKTTLLDVISGYRQRDISGYIYVNDKERDLKRFMKQCSYVMQDGLQQSLVTVHEAMTFVANVKLGSTMTKIQKEVKINEILNNFSLVECKSALTENLSGGQRRRLSIAVELISNPPVLLMDEPTTGLDSTSARHCIEILKNLASTGKTIVCTVHQPSAVIFNMFDNAYVMASGRCVYQGTTNYLVPYLAESDFVCPTYYNPAEHVIELCALCDPTDLETLIIKSENGKSQKWLGTATCWSRIILSSTINIHNLKDSFVDYQSYSSSTRSQVFNLLKRTISTTLRNQTLIRMQFITKITMGFALGLFFAGIGKEASQIATNFNVLFMILMFIMFSSICTRIVTFPQELNVIKREYFNKWYSLRSYFLATTISDFIIQVTTTTMFCVIVYTITDQPMQLFRFVYFTLITILISLWFQDYGTIIGMLLNVENGLIFGMFTTSPWVMFSGFFLYYRDAPIFFQCMYRISILRHALEAAATSVYGFGRKPLHCSKVFCYHRYPGDFMKHVDVDEANFYINVIFMLVSFLLVKMIFYIILKYRIRSNR